MFEFLLTAGCATPAPADSAAAAPVTAHWMADTFADLSDVLVGRILLPGAFNSTSYACAVENGISPDAPESVRALWGTDEHPADDEIRERVVGWARTQDRPLGQQLQDGIRFLELNVTTKDGVLTTWHSVYGVPLDGVLDDVVDFSVTWPDEIVVLTFGLTLESADWPLLGDALAKPRAGGATLCDLIYDGEENAAEAPLSSLRARGRPLVWAPDGELRAYLDSRGDCPLSHGTTDRTWSVTVSTQGVEDALAASVDTRDPQHLLVNDFVFSLDGAASSAEQASYLGKYPGVQEASLALGFSGDFPSRLIATYNADANMNIFAGAYYQDTDLVEAAIVEAVRQ